MDTRDLSKVNFTLEQLRECYVGKKMTQRQIAKHFHVDIRKVRFAMQQWGIEVVSSGERLNQRREEYRIMGKSFEGRGGETRERRDFSLNRYPFTEQELRECLDKHMSTSTIAQKFNVSTHKVRYAVRMLQMPASYNDYQHSLKRGEPVNYLHWHYNMYLKNAMLRGLSFDLSVETFEGLVTQPCYYCGLPPSQKRGTCYFSGLDRLDNTLGYTEENVKPCCSACNYAKRAMSAQEFIGWILRAANHIQSNNLDRLACLDSPVRIVEIWQGVAGRDSL